jgi:hypothetical protein
MTVRIHPMPEWCRKVKSIYRPVAPPIFVDCGKDGPTPEEIELARELFKILDVESQEWYQRWGFFKGVK